MSLLMEEIIVYLLYVSSNIVSMFLLCNATMKRRRPFTVCVFYTILKMIIINIVFRMFCDELIRTNEMIRSVYLTLVSVFAILTYIVILYTFEEDFSKIAVISVCAELVAVGLGYMSKAVTNTLIGEFPFKESAPLHIMNFVSAILTVLLTLLLLRIGKKRVEKIRQWKVKRKKTVMTLFVMYLLFSIVSMYFSYEEKIFLDGIALVVFSVILLVQFVNYFHRETLWENDSLKKHQTIARMQYEAVVLEMEKMKQMQKEIELQMQTVLELGETAENKTEQIERYILSLKKHSENVATGVFCNDWFLDSILHSAKKKCQEKGIEIEFYLQGYQKADIQSEKLAKDVHQLLEATIEKANREISLQIANVKGQIIIKLGRDGKERTMLWSERNMQNW